MNNKVCNPETQIDKTLEMNDRDYLNSILETEKNMSNNLSIALNEASNENLFEQLYEVFDEVKTTARDAFNLMFKNGWYTLEKAEANKITEKEQELNTKLDELNKNSN